MSTRRYGARGQPDMTAMPDTLPAKDDPRYLRAMMERASDLAREHRVRSVFVGIAGPDGDLLAPEFISFVESALRMEDAIFRLLRERAVLLLTDVDREGAELILDRLRRDFQARFAPSRLLDVSLGFVEVDPGQGVVTAKEVLPALFAPTPC